MNTSPVFKPLRRSNAPSIPVVNIDEFDYDLMVRVFRDFGSYMVTGPSIDRIRPLAERVLEIQRTMLSAYDRKSTAQALYDVDHGGSFNGFQDVLAQTTHQAAQLVSQGKPGVIRHQIAVHIKPEFAKPRLPKMTDQETLTTYFGEIKAILINHYHDIAEHFIHEAARSDLSYKEGEEISVLMMRRYFSPEFKQVNDLPDQENVVDITPTEKAIIDTGIPPHSDHGILSFIMDDEAGLEIYSEGQWIPCPHTPGQISFKINLADKALFEMLESMDIDPVRFKRYDFKAGLHRVPQLSHGRMSATMALNAHKYALCKTPLGPVVTFEKFLQSPKELYRDITRDKSASLIGQQFKAAELVHKFPLPKDLSTTFYVYEAGDSLQASFVMVRGKGQKFCSSEMPNLPKKAYEEFSYAFLNQEDALQPTHFPSRPAKPGRLFEVSLKYADDIYIVDAAVQPADTNTSPQEAIARTLMPLKDYKGGYTNPALLIQRELFIEEAVEQNLDAISLNQPQ